MKEILLKLNIGYVFLISESVASAKTVQPNGIVTNLPVLERQENEPKR